MRQHRGEGVRGRAGGGRLAAAVALLPAALLLALLPAAAQPPAGERVFYTRSPEFRIPFNIDGGDGRITGVRLYVSEDFGQSWQLRATAAPGDRAFPFQARLDRWYWFTVQTVDAQNRLNPPVIDEKTSPGLKVCVDTREPIVSVRSVAAQDGGVAVSWTVQDENLTNLKGNKADTLILEYRSAGRGDWVRVPIEQKANGERAWAPEWGGPLEVRLRALDDAGNEGRHTITVNAGPGGSRTVTPGYAGETGTDAGRAAADRRYVNTKEISLKYDVQEVGKSGISEVQLWFTDGRTWQLRGQEKDPKAPYVYKIRLETEGVYGFTLRARSGVGEAEREPQVGDPPQVWIEADWTPPRVTLLDAQVGRGSDTGVLFLTYKAEDKNLDPRGSITFSYATEPNGEWTKFQEKQDNTGNLRWTIPASVPYQIYLRVSATDRAGNVGHDQTKEPVKVDLSRPKAKVIGIEPVGGGP